MTRLKLTFLFLVLAITLLSGCTTFTANDKQEFNWEHGSMTVTTVRVFTEEKYDPDFGNIKYVDAELQVNFTVDINTKMVCSPNYHDIDNMLQCGLDILRGEGFTPEERQADADVTSQWNMMRGGDVTPYKQITKDNSPGTFFLHFVFPKVPLDKAETTYLIKVSNAYIYLKEITIKIPLVPTNDS